MNENEMNYYNNPAVQVTAGKNNLYVAGTCLKYNNRPMVVLEGKMNEHAHLPMGGVLVLPPFGPMNTELMYNSVRQAGFEIIKTLSIPRAVAEFYSIQEQISAKDKQAIVIYFDESENKVNGSITYMEKCNNAPWTGRNLMQVSDQVKEMTRHFVFYKNKLPDDKDKAFDEIYKAIYQKLSENCGYYQMQNGPVMFTGTAELSTKIAARIADEERFFEYRVLAYKPETAAVLGATAFSKEMCLSMKRFAVPKQKTAYYPRQIWGEFDRLKPIEKKAYWKLIDDLTHKRMTGEFEYNDDENLGNIIEAVVHDFPELEIVWQRYKSNYYTSKKYGKKMLEYTLNYTRGGLAKLKKIEYKAEEILYKCTNNGTSLLPLSDEKVFKNIYRYFCENDYEYCKTQIEGKYPKDSYTLQAIHGDGVCQGYTYVAIFLLRSLQLPVRYIHGWGSHVVTEKKGSDHAWILTLLADGLSCRHSDLTWQICMSECRKSEALNDFEYFLADDTRIGVLNHSWDHRKYPAANA